MYSIFNFCYVLFCAFQYLCYYIWKHTELEGVGDYAKQCLKQLRTPKVMTRKCPPSAIEISVSL